MDVIRMVIGLSFLLLISVIDVMTFNKKKGFIPSIVTTLFLIIAFIGGNIFSIYSGVFAGLIALLLTDLEFWGGIADFKCFVACGMLFVSLFEVSVFAFFVTGFGLVYKLVALKLFKDKRLNIPFVPLILVAFSVCVFLFWG